MKKYLTIVFTTLILALLQLSFFSELLGNGLAPDLLLAFCFALLFLGLKEEALFAGFVGGLFLDLLGFSIVGSSAVLYVASLVLYSVMERFVSRGWLTKALGFLFFSYMISSLKSDVVFAMQSFGSLFSLFVNVLFTSMVKRIMSYFGRTGYNINKL